MDWEALPKDNTLVADSILKIAHRAAPALIVFSDEVLAARLSIKYAGAAGSWNQGGNLHILYNASTRNLDTVSTWDVFGRHAKTLADMQDWLSEMQKLCGRCLRLAVRDAKTFRAMFAVGCPRCNNYVLLVL